ncbi:MAG: bifunctional 4-hydroxy-2-oxoglutarate aldolase/2-dehydro-3-deoxy-phosphogluconate aldolase [Planctomycetales bacterium]|nr:bifunctional 4-hydroxy-2-oxoglutarate aldolase/2-dehydro-3-deoxy-phosphogluconate aldolase [Planctomycetales bacterium]
MDSQFPSEISARIEACGVVAVLVIDDAAHAVSLAKSLLEGGIDVMELTLRTPAAIEALTTICRDVPEMLAGIGTILTKQQVVDVVEAGAKFGVAPGLNPNVVSEAQRLGLPFAPGIATPSDVESAIELGCRELKFFPAEPSGGLTYLKSLAAPYAHLGVRYVPLGGVNIDNLPTYISDANIMAVGGSWLAPRSDINSENWQVITDRASAARRAVDEARGE